MRFARALPEDSPFRPREALAGKDARQLARDILAIDDEGYRTAFRGSAMKRAKLRAMKRNAAVVLGNPSLRSGQAALAGDADVLTRALGDPEPLADGARVREHAAWALGCVGVTRRAAAGAVSMDEDGSCLRAGRPGPRRRRPDADRHGG